MTYPAELSNPCVCRPEPEGPALLPKAQSGRAPRPRPWHDGAMTGSPQDAPNADALPHEVVVVGPDGQPLGAVPEARSTDGDRASVSALVQEPAKVMRIGTMIKQLLDEVRSAPLDEGARARLSQIHRQSIAELEDGLAPELIEELERLSLPFTDDGTPPSDAELRIAQAQLVGWLEGLFHGIQAALVAQQMSAKAAFEQMRRQAQGELPSGLTGQQHGSGQYL